jgi:hypothetical protein
MGDASFMVWRQGPARFSAKSVHGLVKQRATSCDFFVDNVLTKQKCPKTRFSIFQTFFRKVKKIMVSFFSLFFEKKKVYGLHAVNSSFFANL